MSLFRAVLIAVLIYFAMRNFLRLLRPREDRRKVKGAPRAGHHQLDESRVQDATFKDIPDK